MKQYYSIEVDEVIDELKTDPKSGLTSTEVSVRLDENGLNELPKASKSFIKIYFAPLFNWLIVIYLIGALVMYIATAVSDDGDMSMIYTTLTIVVINMIVAIVQQARATKKLNALRQLSAPTTTVIRNGIKESINSNQIVVGDILSLNLGDKIPADSRIIKSANLEVNEASLTGESVSAIKNNGSVINNQDSKEIPIGSRKNMLFFGTFITQGNATAVVVSTGVDTEIGKISQELEATETGEIPIREKMNNFGKWLGLLVVIFWLITYLIIIISNPGNDNFVTSLNAAMDIMPINIPLLTTIVMITGVLNMAQYGVIIRNLTSVDSLGRISIVCSDKTGTLTQSKMLVEYVWVNNDQFIVTGNGYSPTGNVVLITDPTAPITIEKIDDFPQLKEIITAGFINNNSTLVKRDIKLESKVIENWDVLGSPTEGALMTLYEKTKHLSESTIFDFEIIKEFPFDSGVKRMTKLVQMDGSIVSYTKGASEVLLPLCSKILNRDGEVTLTEVMKNGIFDFIFEYASKGYRILSLCKKSYEAIPNESDDIRALCECNLTYIGFVTILDPPRDDVKDAVEQCHKAGVEVIMITGDSPKTAKAIAQQVGIFKNESDLVVEGNKIDEVIHDTQIFNKIKVFARVSPKHKQQIIEKYQRQDRVVAMTGDGVNDALALSMADVGVAMGIQGTDVAKEASDMVISDDSFSSIVKGIHQGRGIFARIRAVVFFYIAINLFEGVVAFILSIIMGFPYFLTAPFTRQWLFLSVTVHMFPGLILTFDSVSDDVMKEKPRDSEEILPKTTMSLMMAFGVLLAIAMCIVYFMGINGVYPVVSANMVDLFDPVTGIPLPDGTTLEHVKTLTMLMLVLFICECFLVLQIRRPNKSLIRSIKEDSTKWMYFLIFLLFGAFALLEYVPSLARFFADHNMNFMFMRLTGLDWLVCFSISLICIIGLEGAKFAAREKGIVF